MAATLARTRARSTAKNGSTRGASISPLASTHSLSRVCARPGWPLRCRSIQVKARSLATSTGVKRQYCIPLQRQVGQVQVAMAFAHMAAGAAFGQAGGDGGPLRIGPVLQGLQCLAPSRILDQAAQGLQVVLHHLLHGLRLAPGRRWRGHGGPGLHLREPPGQLHQVGWLQCPLLAEVVEPSGLVKAAHVHGKFDG